jgi:hypothetical protein
MTIPATPSLSGPSQGPSQAPVAVKKAEEAAKIIEDSLAEIEEIPDYRLRQQQTLKVLIKAGLKTDDEEVRKLIRMATVNVHSDERSTVYSAMKIARLTHDALINGCFGSAPLLAKATGLIFDTLQFDARKSAAHRILEEMGKTCDEPGARSVIDLGKEIRRSIFFGTDDHEVNVTRGVLKAIEGGFNETPREILRLGIDLCRSAQGTRFEGFHLTPVAERLINSASGSAEKSTYSFFWKMAAPLRGDRAGEFLTEMIENAATLPPGDAGRLDVAKKSLQFYESRERLSENATNILGHLSSQMRNSNVKKTFALARKISGLVNPKATPGKDKEKGADMTGLLDLAMKEARNNKPLDSDAAVIGFARSLLLAAGESGQAKYDEICGLLKEEIRDEACREIFSSASDIMGTSMKRDGLLIAMDAAAGSLAGKTRDPIDLGMKMADSLAEPLSAEAYGNLLKRLKSDPSHGNQAHILAMGIAALGFLGAHESRIPIAHHIIDMIKAGGTDSTEDPLKLARELTQMVPTVDERFRLMEPIANELLQQTGNAGAAQFLGLARSLVRDCADYSSSCQAFEKVLDKVDELRNGRQLNLIHDSLEIINTIPDKLTQANMLRSLDLAYLKEIIKSGALSSALENPMGDLTPLAENSSARLQVSLDFLNILTACSRAGNGSFYLLREFYDRFPDSLKDVVAYGYFSPVSTDPGLGNLDNARKGLPPADWQALGEAVGLTHKDPNTFALLKHGLIKIDGRAKGEGQSEFRGALSFILLREAEKRLGTHAEVAKIMSEYDDSLKRERYRPSSSATQDAVFRVIRHIIHEAADKDHSMDLIVGHMDGTWKPGDAEGNRKILIETLDAMNRLKEGTLESIDRWVAEKVLGGEESPPSQTIIQEDDYVIIGGIILPKNREA